jgi:hypothetical protein
MYRFALPLPALALALSGCGAGGNESASAANGIAGRTENGQLTARVQGVDLKVNLPPPLRRMTESDDYLYPNGRTVRRGDGDKHFHSDDPPETVAAWYRDPARHERFMIGVTTPSEGGALYLAGNTRNNETLSVRLLPGAQGGTDGSVRITPHS